MFWILMVTAGFVVVLTLAAVYSALVLAHRTDDIVTGRRDDPFGTGTLPGHA